MAKSKVIESVVNNESGLLPRTARRVTLAHVAKLAGVSRTTVSETLNNRPNCWASEKTRKRIRQAAKKLGYRPNLAARALRSGKTHVIGLVSPGFGMGSSHSRAVGLTEAAAKSDYTVTLSSHSNDSESEDIVIRRLLDRGVDGLAVYPVDPGPHNELRRLAQSGFPVVTFQGANLLDFECDDVSVDVEEVGKLQAKHLLNLGRRRVCLANTIPEARITVIREDAIRQEFERAGAPPPISMRLQGAVDRELLDAEALEAPMRAFLKEHHGVIDAIIAGDPQGSLAIRILHELDLRVPEDVAVIGGGDSLLSTYGEVPMTSVNAADDEAGTIAFGLLMNRISGETNNQFQRVINPEKLIVRKSTLLQEKEI